ncbi:VWA domain-containing protein [Nocardioides iriomotensis]|uniref:VWA domain-containing protein n=1 Tax=Nocardioides iriomotensis TaxID=715784 RepID=A0A4Q5J753_9ACTN|nr:VWA domain-containing protein [Nocardioides iriomotensis]RYU13485.1 VWA domain-containing protein [Nocardioides iriomotensis]
MEAALHRFVRLLRLYGVRVSVAEAVDAMHAAAQPGVLGDREVLRAALAVCLVKDRRDLATYDRVFDRFFGLRAVVEDVDEEHSHAHDDLSDEGDLTEFTLSDEPGDNPEQGHSHGKPQDIRKYFRPEDMAQQYNLHQEANRLDMAGMTDEIVLSNENKSGPGEAARVQISTARLHNPGSPGDLVTSPGLQLDTELTVAEEMALLSWLDERLPDEMDGEADPEAAASLAALRAALAPFLENLPQRLKEHLERLMSAQREVETREVEAAQAEHVDEADRAHLEESLRRLLRSLHGAPRPRRNVAARGVVDGRRTMRRNMRYDGVPFRPVTVSKVEDRPRLLVLCDVSLSVRMTSKFTLHLVHSLQSVASQVRTFAFVKDLVEITDLFAEHRIEDALSLVMSGLPAGGVLDVDADSDYGTAFEQFLEQFGSALTRRTTVIVLGDGRGNGNDPRLDVFEEITRRARSTLWLTPEPRYSWALGGCDLPAYSEHCDRVQVVRSLRGLEKVSTTMAVAT